MKILILTLKFGLIFQQHKLFFSQFMLFYTQLNLWDLLLKIFIMATVTVRVHVKNFFYFFFNQHIKDK